MNANINGKTMRALLNIGAMHNFVTEDKAESLGLKVIKEGGTINVVKSPNHAQLQASHKAYT